LAALAIAQNLNLAPLPSLPAGAKGQTGAER